MSEQTDTYARIPAKDRLLESEPLRRWSGLLGRSLVSRIIDTVLDRIKADIPAAAVPDYDDLLSDLSLECRRFYRKRVIRVINGTGIILHTNMGRSPIQGEAWDACRAPNTSYSNLELDLETGKRGKRNGIVPDLITLLTGAEASMVVNNNAAAVYLILSGLARGSEVIVSRGEQVQIGGGFRIPEILSLSGAHLVEVGTTNITTLDDYRRALSEDTACVLSVHRSNFAVRGFTSQPSLSEIKKILPSDAFLFVDQGSGTLTEDIRGETRVSKTLRDGADLVSFSCDKVLGGPQAGIISGRVDLIRRLESNQLYRVFRPGKTVYSLLEEILVRKVNGSSYLQEHIFHDPRSLKAALKQSQPRFREHISKLFKPDALPAGQFSG